MIETVKMTVQSNPNCINPFFKINYQITESTTEFCELMNHTEATKATLNLHGQQNDVCECV